MDNRPIGVFDSGIGGLTVVNSLKKILPNETILYVGDTARVPYGNKSADRIKQYSIEITEWLIMNNCKMIVVACNTASSLVLEYLISSVSIPVVGVIDPVVEKAIRSTKNNKIAVLGTYSTIRSNAYGKRLKAINSKVQVFSQACPLFVPLVEEGWIKGDVPKQIADSYFLKLTQINVDTIILGCTHYPFLKSVIIKTLGKSLNLIDSGEATSKTVFSILKKTNSFSNKSDSKISCYVTDDPILFNEVAERFVIRNIDNVTHIDL